MPYDPLTVKRMLEILPEIERRKRRAKSQRRDQERFAAMSQAPGSGNYTQTQQGGWFPTVAQYQKDYGRIGNQIVGGLGEYLTGRKADKAEEEYGNMQQSEILRVLDQMGQPKGVQGAPVEGQEPPASSNALRGYLNLLGGKDLGIESGSSKVRSTQRLENGNLGLVTDDGIQDTGIKYDYSIKTLEGADGGVYSVGTSGSGRGQTNPVMVGGSEAPPSAPPGQPPAPQVGPPPPGAPNVKLDMLTPEQNQELSSILANISDEGVAGRITQMYIESNAGKAPGAAASAAPPAGPTQLRVLTPAQKAEQEARAKLEVELGAAPRIADLEAQKTAARKEAELNTERTQTARTLLPKARASLMQLEDVSAKLLNHPGLANIVGGLWGRVPDSPTALKYFDAIMAGKPEAGAMALHRQMMGKVFMDAYETLKGGGQITEIEGQRATDAKSRMNRSQSLAEYKTAVNDFVAAVRDGLKKMEQAAGGSGQPGPAQPNARPALPAGFQWED